MLKIRLHRVGRRNDPSYRVIVVDSKKGPKSSSHVEQLGTHDPIRKSTALNGERIKHWLSVGAQASPTVHNLLIREKVIEGKKINVLPRKSSVVKEAKAAEDGSPDASAEASREKEEAKEEVKADAVETPPEPAESSENPVADEVKAKAGEASSPDASTEASREDKKE